MLMSAPKSPIIFCWAILFLPPKFCINILQKSQQHGIQQHLWWLIEDHICLDLLGLGRLDLLLLHLQLAILGGQLEGLILRPISKRNDGAPTRHR